MKGLVHPQDKKSSIVVDFNYLQYTVNSILSRFVNSAIFDSSKNIDSGITTVTRRLGISHFN